MTQTNAEILEETDEIFNRVDELLHHSDPSVNWVKRKFYDLEKVILEQDQCETKKKGGDSSLQEPPTVEKTSHKL